MNNRIIFTSLISRRRGRSVQPRRGGSSRPVALKVPVAPGRTSSAEYPYNRKSGR